MTSHRVKSAHYHPDPKNPGKLSVGAILSLELDEFAQKFTIATVVNDEVNGISGITRDELRRIGQLLIAEADKPPPTNHAARCPAHDGGSCACGAEKRT